LYARSLQDCADAIADDSTHYDTCTACT
jgi:hypothetical protein